MKEINILFLGGSKRISLAERFIKAGLIRKCKVNIFSYELDTQVPIADVAKVILGLKWKDPNLFIHLEKVINDNKIDSVFPFVDPAIEIVSNLAKILPKLYIPISSEGICKIMFNKITANSWFIQNHFPVPSQNISFPLIAKPAKGSASIGIIKIIDLVDLEYFNKKHLQDDYLIQQFIYGDEYTVDCFVSLSGSIVSVVPRKRLEVTSGEATKTAIVRDEEIIKLSKLILSKGDFRGPITIQFIRDSANGKTYIMEINPRFGGGVLASIEAGANSPGFILDELLGIPINENTEWSDNLIMTRSFRETYFYANNN